MNFFDIRKANAPRRAYPGPDRRTHKTQSRWSGGRGEAPLRKASSSSSSSSLFVTASANKNAPAFRAGRILTGKRAWRSIGSDVVIHVRRRAVAAYPEGRSPNHEGRGFGIVQTFQLGLKAAAARAVTGRQIGLLTQFGNAGEGRKGAYGRGAGADRGGPQ